MDSQVITCINLLSDRIILDRKRFRDAAEPLLQTNVLPSCLSWIKNSKKEGSNWDRSDYKQNLPQHQRNGALERKPNWNISIRSFTNAGRKNVDEKQEK